MSTPENASTCPDCAAAVGQPHKDGCDVARCLQTGEQRLQCGSDDFPDDEHPGLDCGEDTWTGEWPGTAECREYGWWIRWDAPPPGERYGSWTPVPEGTPGAQGDLSRLRVECDWEPASRRWVRFTAA